MIVVNSNPATVMTDPELVSRERRRDLYRADHAGDRRQDHREGAAGRAAADDGRADRAQHRAGAGQGRDAGAARGRADRRQCGGDRDGRGPAEIPRGDGPDRARKPALGDRAQPRGGAARRSTTSACRRSSGRASRSAGPAAGSPTTARNSRRSSAAGWRRRPTSEVLIEESVLGWKEYEMEVVRDRADNAIIICSIENIDPMGVHTGDSITVAPALTLTDKEYQRMRSASIAVLREIGVETGGSNVQFAVDPKTGRMVVIEMNPRVSRSLGAGVEGDRLPDRQGRGAAGGRLHAGRDRQRHHRRRDPGELRADDRLCRHQDPALRVREIQRAPRRC